MGQRVYCDQWHPDADADADWWCEFYHRPHLPHSGRPALGGPRPTTTTTTEEATAP